MEGRDAVSHDYPLLSGTYNRRHYLTAYGKEQKAEFDGIVADRNGGNPDSYSGIVSVSEGMVTMGDNGSATYRFSVPSAGTYDVAVRLCFPFWDKNGIYISIDGGRKHFTESRLWWPYWRTTFWSALAKRTYEAAVELFTMLCKKYGLNPLEDGVIISHREGHSRGIASNHGDPEHLWAQLGTGYTMDGFRKAVRAAMGGASFGTNEYTKIMGDAVATAEQMKAYLKAKNPNVAQSVLDMVPLYISEGRAEGVRGDIAFAQSCLETGNFTFSGSAVTLSQNNFCGMGVTSNGMKGNSFDTPQLGIRAQVQHLKAYASTDALKNACIDPRFKYVTRGCAEYVEGAWYAMVDFVTVYGKEDVRFTFKNGMEIPVKTK